MVAYLYFHSRMGSRASFLNLLSFLMMCRLGIGLDARCGVNESIDLFLCYIELPHVSHL